MDKKKIIKVALKDDFKCECGNQSHLDGFYPCNEDGEYVEPSPSWKGHYKCDSCDQIYAPTNLGFLF
ncbi:hypothetical protein [Ferdinandcohnia sp. SAFN-114]|uniref:hypothetical protein n=1 Tax=Ferdinandcohnia sp. SAFN-114 TaxID=3387275 RepID=UPI003F7E95D5